MSKEELLRNLIAEIELIMHDKDYRFVESQDTWYSRESCKALTNEEVFEEIRAELIQLNNETNREIAELKDHTKDLNNKLLNLQLFLKDLRDGFHKGDETYEEIDQKLKELGGNNERNII